MPGRRGAPGRAERRTLAAGGDAALIDALDIFEDLAADAPPDIRDEWALVNDRIAGLAEALDTAGVDPSSYDAENPPTDLAEEDRNRIENAARDLGSKETQDALAAVEQQALHVRQAPRSVWSPSGAPRLPTLAGSD